MLLLSMTAAAQDIHEHSAFVNDSIDPMKEAILNEIVVTGITGTQRLRDASATLFWRAIHLSYNIFPCVLPLLFGN